MNSSRPILQQVSRREMLQVGGLGLMNLTLPQLLHAEQRRSQTEPAPTADACIVIFLNGGPSHLDMWDMKPNEGEGIRGEFKPIATSLPGYQMCEHLPRMAKLAHRSTIVRSMHHGVNNAHAAAVYAALTGHDRGEIGGGAKQTDYPTPGSVVSMIRPHRGRTLCRTSFCRTSRKKERKGLRSLVSSLDLWVESMTRCLF
jgi:hypothetical protein